MARRDKYHINYEKLYPGIEIPPEVLSVLRKGDRKEEYQEVDLKQERFVYDPETKTAHFIPGREDSYERLVEDEKRQFSNEDPTPEEHLMRGQVFHFGGLTWFTMGGAASHDIQDGILDPAAPDFERQYWLMRRMRAMFRVKGVSWWAEEMPSPEEYQEALANLDRVNWTVDCILTHCAPSSVVRKVNPSYGTDELTDFLETISQRCKFAYWFFGHYHDNRIIDEKYILQWEQISQLE